MAKINRHNYESFFLDYFENNLSKNDVAELFLFLEKNKDLKPEFETFENIVLEPETIEYNTKHYLKKHIDKTNIEAYIIADLENELAESDKEEYINFISENALYAPLIARYKRTILPKEKIIYPDKNSLKKSAKLTPLFWKISSAVSVAVILLFLALLQVPNQQSQYKRVALKPTNKVSFDYAFSLPEIKNTQEKTLFEKKNKKVRNNVFADVMKEEKTIHKKVEQEPIYTEYKKLNTVELVAAKSESKNTETKTLFVSTKQEQTYTLKELFRKQLKKKIFKDDLTNIELNKNYILTAITQNKNISIEKNKKKKRTKIKIGKFEFYRSKHI